MSCKNCSNGCPASEVTGKNCDPVEAEDLVIEFENQSENKGKIRYRKDYYEWEVSLDGNAIYYKLLKDAKECAEILKRSV